MSIQREIPRHLRPSTGSRKPDVLQKDQPDTGSGQESQGYSQVPSALPTKLCLLFAVITAVLYLTLQRILSQFSPAWNSSSPGDLLLSLSPIASQLSLGAQVLLLALLAAFLAGAAANHLTSNQYRWLSSGILGAGIVLAWISFSALRALEFRPSPSLATRSGVFKFFVIQPDRPDEVSPLGELRSHLAMRESEAKDSIHRWRVLATNEFGASGPAVCQELAPAVGGLGWKLGVLRGKFLVLDEGKGASIIYDLTRSQVLRDGHVDLPDLYSDALLPD